MSRHSDIYGYVYKAPSAGRDKLAEALASRNEFTVNLPMNNDIKTFHQMALISFDGEHLHSAALMIGGRASSTIERNFKFHNHVPLHELPIKEIEARTKLPWGQLTPAQWHRVISVVLSLSPPDVCIAISHLEEMISQPYGMDPDLSATKAMEKDAVGLAMEIGGISRSALLTTGDPAQTTRFMSDLRKSATRRPSDRSGISLREDRMLEHDHHVFGDWKRIEQHLLGWVEFRKDDKFLRVLNVNRDRLENITGVDLIYHHLQFNAYIMVQYKRMIPERGEMVYRPGHDTSYTREVERMKRLNRQGTSSGHHDYRLSSNACYFKFCRAVQFDQSSQDLVEGAYLPLDYWIALVEGGHLTTKQGAIVATWKDLKRHLSNTQFVYLVGEGWIGTRGDVSEQVARVIDEGLDTNRSLMLAYQGYRHQ